MSQNCEQFIKFECHNDVAFVQESVAWWVSRDGRKMSYWGGNGGSANSCAFGVTDSCLNGQKYNCYNGGSGWREDSGLLTDKSGLLVTQIRPQGPEEMCLSLEHQNPSKTSEKKMGYFDRVTVSLQIL